MSDNRNPQPLINYEGSNGSTDSESEGLMAFGSLFEL